MFADIHSLRLFFKRGMNVIKRFNRFLNPVCVSKLYPDSCRNMANSKFEYVKLFETQETLLKNCWIVIRIDGKGFHKFADVHNFTKPNDERALRLMNRCALSVMNEFFDIVLSYGQSDEYSFVFKKDSEVYNRRSHKLISTVCSMFSSAYVFNWSKYFDDVKLLYPPGFDGRAVLYPSDQNLVDYLSWRQADVHVNNLYNTTFWNLVLKSNLTTTEAEQQLCGTFSADKNEILFSKFNINYNNELIIFRKGTTLLRKDILDLVVNRRRKVIVDIHEDMIQDKFWETHPEILSGKSKTVEKQLYEIKGDMSSLVEEQLQKKRKLGRKEEEIKITQ